MSVESSYTKNSKLEYFGYLGRMYSTSLNYPPAVPGKDNIPLRPDEDQTFYNNLLRCQTLFELTGVPNEEIKNILSVRKLDQANRSGTTSDILKYVLDFEDTTDNPEFLELEREITQKVISSHSLPGNLEQEIIDNPLNLRRIIRGVGLARVLAFSASGITEPLTKTSLWHFSVLNPTMSESASENSYDMPESIFYNDPPVGHDISARNSILIIGTSAEASDIEREIAKMTPAQEINGIKVEFSSTMAGFWEQFLAEELFVDNDVTKPRGIITTGYIRNYNCFGGETVEIMDRLMKIADKFRIPVKFIKPTHI